VSIEEDVPKVLDFNPDLKKIRTGKAEVNGHEVEALWFKV
jgi:hypothetical protein